MWNCLFCCDLYLRNTTSSLIIDQSQISKYSCCFISGHDGQASEENIVPRYRGIINAFKQIIADEGYLGLYKGLSVTVTSSAIAASLFFTM